MNTFTFPGAPYSITHRDELNWTIDEAVVNQKGDNIGKERTVVLGYYPTLDRALMALARRVVDAETIADINSYIDRIAAIARELREATQ